MDDTGIREPATILRFRRWLQATPDRVFRAWTRPEALKLWWCPDGWILQDVHMDLRVGGAYRISMMPASGPLAEIVTVSGQFLEVEPNVRLVYTWRWQGAFAGMPETRVTVRFASIRGGTEIALTQEDLAIPFCTRHLSGWLAAIHRLERSLTPIVLQWSS